MGKKKKTVNKTAKVERSGRNLLAALSIKYKGDWQNTFQAIKNKEELTDADLDKYIKSVKGFNFITIIDQEYPESLKKIHQPPLVLYYKGDINLLNKEKILGVTGTRDMSEYGKKTTVNIVSDFIAKNKDVPIVTGFNRGISKEAASAATAVDGKVIFVMISGIQNIYPKEMKGLYDAACETGLVISEYPFDVDPKPDNGPMRNRLIAGIGSSLLVTESKFNSGTSLTVMFTLALGKDVLAVPCNVDAENSVTNKYIQDGAMLVMNADDVDYMMK